MAGVFLSYARDDAPKAKTLAKFLESAGHTVWWDRHIHGGSDYSDEIEAALDRADVVLVLWSNKSVHSQWVRDEAAVGRDSGRLVPVLLDESSPPLGFRQIQSIPMGGWSGRGRPPDFDSVTAAIAAHAADATRSSEPAPQKPKSRAVPGGALALAMILAILSAGAWLLFAENRPASLLREEKVSLAVLPFTDLSPARDKSFFAEGVAEEILSTLSAEPGIKVLGRTSARQIERNLDPKAIRASLGITHIVEGSMRTDRDQLRVNVRLIDTKDGAEIWHQEYQGQLGDIFAVQDRIAANVVENLRGKFRGALSQGSSPHPGTASYEQYLAARALARTRSTASLAKAMELAKKAVAADPNHAAAHALLAQLYIHLSDSWKAYGTMPLEEARRMAMPHAREAIRLAPKMADGHAALGLIVPPADAIEPLTRAIDLDPSRAEPHIWLATVFTELGRQDEALEQGRQAAAVEPLWEVPIHIVVQSLAASGWYDEALDYVHQFERRGGSKAQVHRLLAAVARWRGDVAQAALHSRSALALDPSIPYLPALLASDYYLLGLQNESLAILPKELAFTRSVRSAGFASNFRLSDATKVWSARDGDIAIYALGERRDWQSLLAIYAAAPTGSQLLCNDVQWQGPLFALALLKAGRSAEARDLLVCIERRLELESRSRARGASPLHPEVSDLEFRRATLLALKGDKAGAVTWLARAVDRGWVGRPYSARLRDYPQFDVLRGDPRLPQLQRRVDANIARERSELLSTAAAAP